MSDFDAPVRGDEDIAAEKAESYQRAADERRAGHARELAKLEDEHAAAKLTPRESFDLRVSELERLHAEALRKRDEAHEEAIFEATRALEAITLDVEKQIETLEEKHASALEALRQEHRAALADRDAREAELDNAVQAHQAELASRQRAFDVELAKVNRTAQLATRAHRAAMDVLRNRGEKMSERDKQQAAELQQAQRQFQEQLVELERRHDDELARHELAHAEQTAELVRRHDGALAARAHNLDTIREAMRDKLTAQKQEHARTVGRYASALKEAEAQIAQLRAQLEQALGVRDPDEPRE